MECCAICGCEVHRGGAYATPTVEGRSHASRHHFVPERFFGRSNNRRGSQRERLFETSPWGHEGETAVFCYDCHEELIHNPVFLPTDLEDFARLVELRGLGETQKTESRERLAGRIQLLHEVLRLGLDASLKHATPGRGLDQQTGGRSR